MDYDDTTTELWLVNECQVIEPADMSVDELKFAIHVIEDVIMVDDIDRSDSDQKHMSMRLAQYKRWLARLEGH